MATPLTSALSIAMFSKYNSIVVDYARHSNGKGPVIFANNRDSTSLATFVVEGEEPWTAGKYANYASSLNFISWLSAICGAGNTYGNQVAEGVLFRLASGQLVKSIQKNGSAGTYISPSATLADTCKDLTVYQPIQLWLKDNRRFAASIDYWGRMFIGDVSQATDTTALLQLSSTTMGFLKPKMTTTQRNAIPGPQAGLEIYNTTTNSPEYYNGTNWVSEGSTANTLIIGSTAVPSKTLHVVSFCFV